MFLTSNTIIYCEQWADVVDFYRDGLGLQPSMERDWFVEFELLTARGIEASAVRARAGSV